MLTNILLAILIIALLLFLLLIGLVLPGRHDADMLRPFANRYYAHRGLYQKDQSIPENSLTAFNAACENGFGMELDVQLSKDGEVVVFHDDNLKRMCGIDQPVSALTLAELKDLRLAGTAEQIPTFTEMLEVVAGRGPLIVELKPSPVAIRDELCRKTCQILKAYQGDYCVESFDPAIVSWFKAHAPEIMRGQLIMPYGRYNKKIPAIARFAMSRCLTNATARPHFIACDIRHDCFPVTLAEKLGAIKVAWTSRQAGDAPGNDMSIFGHYLPGGEMK